MATDAEPGLTGQLGRGRNTAQSDPRLHRYRFPDTLFSEAAHWLSSPARSVIQLLRMRGRPLVPCLLFSVLPPAVRRITDRHG